MDYVGDKKFHNPQELHVCKTDILISNGVGMPAMPKEN